MSKKISRKEFLRQSAATAAAAAALLSLGGAAFAAKSGQEGPFIVKKRKIMILGFDGMDPDLLKQYVDRGIMPNCEKVMRRGDFKPLATSTPPQTPIAWSDFITGMDPGGHQIFDFIHRDPKTMMPFFSTASVTEPGKIMNIGKWRIPLKSGEPVLLRKGKAFWEYLDDYDIPSVIHGIPSNFPIVETKGRSLSGMGTPDIQGGYSNFSYYTSEYFDPDVSGGEVFQVEVKNGVVNCVLKGPANSFLEGAPDTEIPFKVYVDKNNDVAKISIQEHEILLKSGEWSEWKQVEFELMPVIGKMTGICRFYLKQTHPEFKLYVSPINIDPSNPAMPISTPDDYCKELYKEIGFFHTIGLPEDFNALKCGVLSDGEFIQQISTFNEERNQMFDFELARFNDGVFFYYYGVMDRLCHMFWRTMDDKHPLYTEQLGKGYGKIIEWIYTEFDKVVGRALAKVDSNTTFYIVSDHGFAPYYRSFNLNTWLLEKGFAVLEDPLMQGEYEMFANTDWRKTRAYGLGINGLYLNMEGREKNGSVSPKSEDFFLKEIKRQLLDTKDPETGRNVVSSVAISKQHYIGKNLEFAPDLIVGCSRGYRIGWDSILGSYPMQTFEDNNDKWSGDHCIDPNLVPGILLCNKQIRRSDPALRDIPASVLAEYGIKTPPEMIGRNIF